MTMDFDINASVVWKKDYTLGLTFRTGGGEGDIGCRESVLGHDQAEMPMFGVGLDQTPPDGAQYFAVGVQGITGDVPTG